MTLSIDQKKEIFQIINEKFKEKLDSYKENDDMNKPFYFEMFSKKIVYSTSLVHSIYTWFGNQWECFAEIIARGNAIFSQVQKGYTLEGELTRNEQSTIDSILKDLERLKKKNQQHRQNLSSVKTEIQSSYNQDDDTRPISITVDLYLRTSDNEEYFLEIKSPKPNKNEVRAAKHDLLDIIAIRQKERDLASVNVFLALPYNPYYSEEYNRWTVKKFFIEREDLLVGKDFWDLLGGTGTYEELLEIFKEVGNAASKQLDKIIKSHK